MPDAAFPSPSARTAAGETGGGGWAAAGSAVSAIMAARRTNAFLFANGFAMRNRHHGNQLT